MGSIVSFMPRRVQEKRTERLPGEAAAVIIFPGVRYERHPEEADAVPPAQRDAAPQPLH